MNPPRIVLASTSPYRRALLARLRLPFEVQAPAVDESALPREPVRATAVRLVESVHEPARGKRSRGGRGRIPRPKRNA